jgi:hypothetical protein
MARVAGEDAIELRNRFLNEINYFYKRQVEKGIPVENITDAIKEALDDVGNECS